MAGQKFNIRGIGGTQCGGGVMLEFHSLPAEYAAGYLRNTHLQMHSLAGQVPVASMLGKARECQP